MKYNLTRPRAEYISVKVESLGIVIANVLFVKIRLCELCMHVQ